MSVSVQIMSQLQTHSDTFRWKNFSHRIGIGLFNAARGLEAGSMTGRQSTVSLAEAESEAPNRNPAASRTTPEPLIFVVSGEASGDNLAGSLMQALKAKTGGRVRFAGVGGPQSERQGLQSLFPMRELSVMGLAEVLPHRSEER